MHNNKHFLSRFMLCYYLVKQYVLNVLSGRNFSFKNHVYWTYFAILKQALSIKSSMLVSASLTTNYVRIVSSLCKNNKSLFKLSNWYSPSFLS